jgi:hypothetical protein
MFTEKSMNDPVSYDDLDKPSTDFRQMFAVAATTAHIV